MTSILQCMDCGRQYRTDTVIYTCDDCGGLLDVVHDLDALRPIVSHELFDSRLGSLDFPYNSGVWRYKELVYPDAPDALIVSRPEGNTNLYPVPRLAKWAGVRTLYLKHEGENPTGSFKDRGMTGGVTQARILGKQSVACASTGNTSASLAAYAAWANIRGIVLFQNKQVALGKLAQAIAYGATCIRVNADFDKNLALVREISSELDIYVLNSVNPFRLEGQKTIMIEMLQQLRWRVPDWVVCPGGNLGNSSAFGKALRELYDLGLIDRLPRLAIIQAEGANPLYRAYQRGFDRLEPMHAETIATAIKIGSPVSYAKAVRALRWTDGVVEQVSDQEIMEAKALVDGIGIGCEPASGCSLAGIRKLVETGTIKPHETVVGVLTGHVLKDPDATIDYHADRIPNIRAVCPNRPIEAEGTLEDLRRALSTPVPTAT
ncbi:MAG: threonine synthase [Phototrophicales bacterium]|nr:MAG: threonine synthase [Phototrophicales bacterium]